MSTMKVYPIFLNDLRGRKCIVFGGGHDAERKTLELLEMDAAVTFIGREAPEPVQEAAARGELVWMRRAYQPGDLAGAFLAIATETNPEATAPMWEEAQREKVLFNGMDDVPHCSFVAGSVIRRGPLVISISSSGCAPALSVRLREKLEQTVTEAYGRCVELFGSLRGAMAARYPDAAERKRLWYRLVDSDILALVEQGREADARARIEEISGIAVEQKEAVAA